MYLEEGKHHPDTVVYKDEEQLEKLGKHPKTITAIWIWVDGFIVGIEVFYDGQSAGAKFGSAYHPGVAHQDFVLEHGEQIIEISGAHGDIIDSINFHTSHWRMEHFGVSTGGNPFSIKVLDDWVVKGLVYGFGGHMHFIGAHFGEAYVPIVKSQHAGKTHGDTVHFDDFTTALAGKHNIRIKELWVAHDGNLVFGIEAIYEADG